MSDPRFVTSMCIAQLSVRGVRFIRDSSVYLHLASFFTQILVFCIFKPWGNGLASQRKFTKPKLALKLCKARALHANELATWLASSGKSQKAVVTLKQERCMIEGFSFLVNSIEVPKNLKIIRVFVYPVGNTAVGS